ncbi:MAG: zinc-ribbon domain-containing protein [Promethearchaeota archaeon]
MTDYEQRPSRNALTSAWTGFIGCFIFFFIFGQFFFNWFWWIWFPIAGTLIGAITTTIKYFGMEGKKCTKCGSQLAPNAEYCKKCGARVYARCPACGEKVKGTAQFCEKCGHKLSDEIESQQTVQKQETEQVQSQAQSNIKSDYKFCPACGEKVKGAAQFCEKCGIEL